MPEIHDFAAHLAEHMPHYVFLEKAQSMPQQGVASTFNYGDHYGQLQGVIVALKLRFTLVPPKVWQQTMFRGTPMGYKPKQRASIACRRLFPGTSMIATPKAQKPHEGLVDAALLALFGYRTLSETSL